MDVNPLHRCSNTCRHVCEKQLWSHKAVVNVEQVPEIMQAADSALLREGAASQAAHFSSSFDSKERLMQKWALRVAELEQVTPSHHQ
jgi:hypothetical protein